MSLLVTFAGLSEPDLLLEQQPPAAGSGTPGHCGVPMELETPALGAAVGYTFEPDDRPVIQLPPVWRCSCGFQLDAWLPPAPYVGTAPDPIPSAAHLSH